MKLWVKDLYIQILKFAPDKNVDYIIIVSHFFSPYFILSTKKVRKKFSVQEFINNLSKNK